MEITKSNHDGMSGRIFFFSALYTHVFGMSDVCTCLVHSVDTLI